MSTYLFDTENKRAIKHSKMLLDILNKTKTTDSQANINNSKV